MSLNLRIAVLGIGSLGKEHARVYAELAATQAIEFVGVYDVCEAAARTISRRHRVLSFKSVAEASAACNAFSIVTPTHTHFSLAEELLRQGKHVLVEKPMTANALEASKLVELARRHDCVLQVGHIEQFNRFSLPAKVATEPRFIEVHRLSPFPARSTDIGVAGLDDSRLDVVLAFVKSPITSIDAVGIPVLSQSEDIANARLRFANGCVANLTASRVSPERMRKIRVFSSGPMTSYISLDYRAQEGFIYRIARAGEEESSLLKKLLHAKDSMIAANLAANGSCGSRFLSPKTNRSSWNCKASSSAYASDADCQWRSGRMPMRRLRSRARFKSERSIRPLCLSMQPMTVVPSKARETRVAAVARGWPGLASQTRFPGEHAFAAGAGLCFPGGTSERRGAPLADWRCFASNCACFATIRRNGCGRIYFDEIGRSTMSRLIVCGFAHPDGRGYSSPDAASSAVRLERGGRPSSRLTCALWARLRASQYFIDRWPNSNGWQDTVRPGERGLCLLAQPLTSCRRPGAGGAGCDHDFPETARINKELSVMASCVAGLARLISGVNLAGSGAPERSSASTSPTIPATSMRWFSGRCYRRNLALTRPVAAEIIDDERAAPASRHNVFHAGY
jgi:predicted dehydrogenase